MKKWMLIPAGLIVLAIIALAAFSSDDNADNAEVKTALIKKGDLRIEVLANGTVTPDVEVIVKSKAGGEITSFPFDEGDHVKKGSVIVTLDPRMETAKANQAEANLLMARAKLDKARVALKDAEVKLARQKKLFEDGIISRQELDDAEITSEKAKSDVKIAEAELIQTKEALNEVNDRLADTQIKAPLTGTILKKFVDQGQVIASTLSSASEGTQIFSMADLDYIYVNALVDEVDISKIRPGQEAFTSIDSLPGKLFTGRVKRIAPKGKLERTVTVFEVVIEVTDKDKSALRPGMTADVKVLTELIKDALLIPNEALKVKDNQTGVYTVTPGKEPEFVPVKAGKTDGILTVVENGLKEGAEIALSLPRKNDAKKPKKRFFF